MLKEVHTKLLAWYTTNGRHDLPWRNTSDVYHIYISEIMLQQTQVKTVLERFYFPFLEAFPTLQDLADASLDEVLKKWEGLGYYTRARNLHKTALVSQDGLPQSLEELYALPGIGKSTAHAIAAFGYKTAVPILDANVKRILYRVFAVEKASEKQLWELAYKLFDSEHPYEYNQAMMDIGAMVCSKTKPLCESCPFESICLAKEDDPLHYPTPKKRKVVPKHFVNLIIYHDEEKLGMYQRSTRFLHGLWGFEQVDRDVEISGRKLGNVTHQYSHFHVDADVYYVTQKPDTFVWHALEDIKALAISTLDAKALQLFHSTIT